MSDNWVVQNLQNVLETWNEKLAEIWTLVTQSPQSFKGGIIWNVMVGIHGAVQAVGLALVVLFFVIGVMKTCGSFADLKRPEVAIKVFVRFAIAKAGGHLWARADERPVLHCPGTGIHHHVRSRIWFRANRCPANGDHLRRGGLWIL